MLVLTRKRGEAIAIGPDIRVVVLQTKGGQVRIGIEAPRSVEIHRDEVYARVRDENQIAAAYKFYASGEATPIAVRTKLIGPKPVSKRRLLRIV